MRVLFLILLFLSATVSGFAESDTFSVFFRTNESTLTEGMKQRLDAAIYNDAISFTNDIQIIGYADQVGGSQANQRLSEARAKAVRRYLVQSGFKADHVTTVIGKGSSEARPGEYPRDRRVDVVRGVPAAQPEAIAPVAASLPQVLSTAKAGESIKLEKIFFKPGLSRFADGAAEALGELYTGLAQNPQIRIKIEGNVCCTGGKPDGLDEATGLWNLSVTRALAVRDFLVQKGISASRLQYEGMGRRKPVVYDERNDADAQANRRVEIVVLP